MNPDIGSAGKRDELYAYLMEKAQRERERDSRASEQQGEQARSAAVMAALSNMASSAGSLGGKRADDNMPQYAQMLAAGAPKPEGKAALYEQLAAKRAQAQERAAQQQGMLTAQNARHDATTKAAQDRHTATFDETKRHNQETENIARTNANKPRENSGPTWSPAGMGEDGQVLYVNPKNPTQMQTVELPKGFKAKGDKDAKTTGDQFKVAGYGRRLEQAEDVFTALAANGYDRTDKKSALYNHLALPVMQGAEYKQQEQAERNFINSVLRRESGASISPTEFGSAEKQYFPRPGDPPELKLQKKRNRQQVMASLKAESGAAYDKVPRISGVPEAGAQAPPAVSPEDQEALEWANSAPDDPRAIEIKKRLGAN